MVVPASKHHDHAGLGSSCAEGRGGSRPIVTGGLRHRQGPHPGMSGSRAAGGGVPLQGDRGSRWGLRRRAVAVGALLVATLSACATVPDGSAVTSRSTSATASSPQVVGSAQPALARALQAWSGFPVTDTPRPVVMVGQRVAAPAGGFPTGDAKVAFGQGLIEAPSSLPTGPATAEGYPLITAAAAWAELTAVPGRTGIPTPTTPLVTTAVRFGSGTFETDRGPRDLPAWLFSFQGMTDPAAVLALAPPAVVFPPASAGYPSRDPSVMGALLDADGRTLTIKVFGAPAGTGPCTADYTLDVAESSTAVAFLVVTHTHGQAGPACISIGVLRKVTTTLGAPLGARVLASAATTLPIPVTTPGS